MPKFCVILPAAGKSSRFGDLNYKKPFAPLNNRAVWLHTAQYFLNRKDVAQVILVVSPEDYEDVLIKYRAEISINDVDVVQGGAERADSIENAISKIRPECDFVCVHDAARPCLMSSWIDDVFRVAVQTGAAMLAVPVSDSLKRVIPNPNFSRKKRGKPKELSLDALLPDDSEPDDTGDGVITESVDRSNLWRAQTPQVFRRDWFEKIYAGRPRGKSAQTTDDSMLFEQAGHSVHVVEASELNLKITTRSDLQLAEAILKILPGPKKNVFHPFADDDLFR